MSTQYDIDFIKQAFVKESYTLLTTCYKNKKQKLEYLCPNGHRGTVAWDNWNNGGNRCAQCSGNVPYTIGQTKEIFEKDGYILLTTEYKNAHTKLKYMCPKGHTNEMNFNKWQQGQRCPDCRGKVKMDLDYIRKIMLTEDYILLEYDYKNSEDKLSYICPKGHVHAISWANWSYGKRCPYCAEKISPEFKDRAASFKNENYILLSTNYITNKTKLNYVCPHGHRHSITWSDWKTGYRCPTCAHIRNSGPGSYNWKGGISCEPYCQDWSKDLKEFIKERDEYRCLNPYCGELDTKLVVHHINYIKKECNVENLITVCNTCNIKANKDRAWHRAWYQAIMYRRYGYEY